jgi:hypothetical protein
MPVSGHSRLFLALMQRRSLHHFPRKYIRVKLYFLGCVDSLPDPLLVVVRSLVKTKAGIVLDAAGHFSEFWQPPNKFASFHRALGNPFHQIPEKRTPSSAAAVTLCLRSRLNVSSFKNLSLRMSCRHNILAHLWLAPGMIVIAKLVFNLVSYYSLSTNGVVDPGLLLSPSIIDYSIRWGFDSLLVHAP